MSSLATKATNDQQTWTCPRTHLLHYSPRGHPNLEEAVRVTIRGWQRERDPLRHHLSRFFNTFIILILRLGLPDCETPL